MMEKEQKNNFFFSFFFNKYSVPYYHISQSFICMCICIYMHIYMYTYVYVHVCMYVFKLHILLKMVQCCHIFFVCFNFFTTSVDKLKLVSNSFNLNTKYEKKNIQEIIIITTTTTYSMHMR